MSPEEQKSLHERTNELLSIAGDDVTAAAILLLADRLVGVLDGVLSRLRTIEQILDNGGVRE